MNEYVEMPDGDLAVASHIFDLLDCGSRLHAYLVVNAPSYMQDSPRYQQLIEEYERAADRYLVRQYSVGLMNGG